jgi:sulfur carrier protein
MNAVAATVVFRLNGESHEESAPLSVAALLERAGLVDRRVAVELNGAVVPKSRHATTMIAAGDQVEIVHALGGG